MDAMQRARQLLKRIVPILEVTVFSVFMNGPKGPVRRHDTRLRDNSGLRLGDRQVHDPDIRPSSLAVNWLVIQTPIVIPVLAE